MNLRKTNQEGKNERKPLLYVDGTYLKFRRGGILVEFQSCVLHKIRNTLNKVRKRDRALVAEDLKRMYETHNEGDLRAHFERFKRNWAKF
ncbi:MAG: transposase [Caldimicrobium sp.]